MSAVIVEDGGGQQHHSTRKTEVCEFKLAQTLGIQSNRRSRK